MARLAEFSHDQLLKRQILDESLGDWKFLLSIKQQSKALSLGFYSIGRILSLSRTCTQLFVFSEIPHTEEFYGIVKAVNNKQNNIHFIYGWLENYLPFLEQIWDLIDIDWNGFLSAHKLQKRGRISYIEKIFQEVYRILKPGGKIYFSSCSSLVAWTFKKRHLQFEGCLSFWIKKLKMAGFKRFERYLLYPDPYYFRVIFSLDSQKDYRAYLKLIPDIFWGRGKFFKRYFLAKILNSENLNYFLPGFAIVAEK